MLRIIVFAAGATAVIVGERSLTHVTMQNRVITGALMALPFVLVLLYLEYRKSKSAKPAAPQRTAGYPFRGQ